MISMFTLGGGGHLGHRQNKCFEEAIIGKVGKQFAVISKWKVYCCIIKVSQCSYGECLMNNKGEYLGN